MYLTRKIPITIVLSALAICLILPAAGMAQDKRPANPSAEWTKACTEQVETKLRKERPTTKQFQIAEDTLERWAESDDAIGISGSGKLLGPGGTWRRFSFECTWDSANSRLTKAEASEEKGAGEVCQRAVQEAIRKDRKDARDLKMDASSIAEVESGKNTTVSGKGQFKGGPGSAHQFTFDCTFDNQAGKATNSSWKMAEAEEEQQAATPATASASLSVDACRNAVNEKLHGQQPNVGALQVFEDSIETATGATGTTQMTGRGQYDGGSGKSKGLRFECTFDDASGTVIRATYHHRG